MKKSEFLEKISNSSRDELDKILHERCKPVKIIYPVVRIKRGIKEE
jgi:hypothetical protein